MASVVIAGDTSGTVTLAAPAVAGTTTITLPTTSGTMAVTGGSPSFANLTVTGGANFATSSGSVGIGTSSPWSSISLNTPAAATDGYLGIKDPTYGGDIRFGKGSGINNDAIAGVWSNNNFQFYTNSAERMRITNNGDFYVGTTTGTIGTSNKGFSINGGDGEVRLSRLVGGSSPVFNAYGSNGEARIMGDGDLENTNNRYTGISDIKFKQNVVDATSQWNDIKAIKVRKYELIANPDRQHIGCVAQELQEVCPGLVIDRQDDKGETYKSVAYSILYMKAVKALQEAMERIEKLETEVQALKGAQ